MMHRFSPREHDILHLLAQHHTYAEIAAILGISINTVRNRICIIFLKTNVHTHIKLVAYAVDQGYGKKEDSHG
jgi:DNA-binding CsgD family transcriptional regulator